MINDILETVEGNGNTVFLDIPKEEYFMIYDKEDRTSAQQFTDLYFEMKQKDGIPNVVDILESETSNTIRLIVKVDQKRNFKLQEYDLPHVFDGEKNV